MVKLKHTLIILLLSFLNSSVIIGTEDFVSNAHALEVIRETDEMARKKRHFGMSIRNWYNSCGIYGQTETIDGARDKGITETVEFRTCYNQTWNIIIGAIKAYSKINRQIFIRGHMLDSCADFDSHLNETTFTNNVIDLTVHMITDSEYRRYFSWENDIADMLVAAVFELEEACRKDKVEYFNRYE